MCHCANVLCAHKFAQILTARRLVFLFFRAYCFYFENTLWPYFMYTYVFLVVIQFLALIRWRFSHTVCIFDLRKTFLLAILYREHFIVQNLLVLLFVPYHNFSRKLFVFGFGESFQCVFFKLICLSLVDPTQPKPTQADSVFYSFISCFSAIYLFSFEFIYTICVCTCRMLWYQIRSNWNELRVMLIGSTSMESFICQLWWWWWWVNTQNRQHMHTTTDKDWQLVNFFMWLFYS